MQQRLLLAWHFVQLLQGLQQLGGQQVGLGGQQGCPAPFESARGTMRRGHRQPQQRQLGQQVAQQQLGQQVAQ